MDALGHTVITQRRKYIPILNTHVTSKVFNEVNPSLCVEKKTDEKLKFCTNLWFSFRYYRLVMYLHEAKRKLNWSIPMLRIWKVMSSSLEFSWMNIRSDSINKYGIGCQKKRERGIDICCYRHNVVFYGCCFLFRI